MNKENVFSDEYNIDNTTEPAVASDVNVDDKLLQTSKSLFKKIESDYALLKPRREIIKAKVIDK